MISAKVGILLGVQVEIWRSCWCLIKHLLVKEDIFLERIEVKDPAIKHREYQKSDCESVVKVRVRSILTFIYVIDWREIAQELHEEVKDEDDLYISLTEPIVHLQDVNKHDSCGYQLRRAAELIALKKQAVMIDRVLRLQPVEDPGDA